MSINGATTDYNPHRHQAGCVVAHFCQNHVGRLQVNGMKSHSKTVR